jgi:hypothetical protein
MGKQIFKSTGGLGGDLLKDILGVAIRIQAVELRRPDQVTRDASVIEFDSRDLPHRRRPNRTSTKEPSALRHRDVDRPICANLIWARVSSDIFRPRLCSLHTNRGFTGAKQAPPGFSNICPMTDETPPVGR